MPSHTLDELASFVRDLGSECTCLIIYDNYLIAGSKNGKIICWDIKNGQEIWNLKVDGPISDIEVNDLIYTTASAEVHAIEIESGILKWSINIGGSSDLLKVDNDSIWVTSSLYEIEVQDYTETTLFRFNKNSLLIIHRNKKSDDKISQYLNIIEEKNYGLSKIFFCKFI